MPDLHDPAASPSRVARAASLPRVARAGLGAFVLLAAAGVSQAQPYRHVAPDGRVTYSDVPPAGASVAPRAASGGAPAAAGAPRRGNAPRDVDGPAAGDPLTALPYAVRAAAAHHPVVLYTSADCAPCGEARAHLSRRGVPFAERQVSTAADVAALRQRGFGADGFPAVSIGAQRLTGFDAGAWDPLLDAAGYPKRSVLPSGWRAPAARPLGDAAGGKAAADGASGASPAGASSLHASGPQARPVASEAPVPGSTHGTPAREAAAATGSSGFRF